MKTRHLVPGQRMITLFLALLLLCFLLYACSTEKSPPPSPPRGGGTPQPTRLHTEGTWVRDTDNRAVILRGINVGSRSKLPPFLPFEDLRYLDQLADWGMNSIRLVFTWEGVEPVEGEYDESYLDRLEEIMDGCAEREILVILDSHQDLFARNFCGDGFPDWAVHPDYRGETCPEPYKEWPLNYVFSPGVVESFSRFWDLPELQDAYIRMMVHLAERFGSHPALVGMDLLNEPYDLSYLLFNGAFEREQLIPFYQKLIPAIRQPFPDSLLSYGTTGLFSLGLPTYLEPLGWDNLLFGAHWYDPLELLLGQGSDLDGMRARLAEIVEMAEEWNVGVYIGEYGVHTDHSDNLSSLSGVIDLIEAFMVGSAIWAYNPTDVEWNDENTSLVNPGGGEKPHVDVFVRPYPARIAGTPLSYGFDAETGTFSLSFRADPGPRGPTEIVVPGRTYPAGFKTLLEDGSFQWDSKRGRLLVHTPQDGRVHNLQLIPNS